MYIMIIPILPIFCCLCEILPVPTIFLSLSSLSLPLPPLSLSPTLYTFRRQRPTPPFPRLQRRAGMGELLPPPLSLPLPWSNRSTAVSVAVIVAGSEPQIRRRDFQLSPSLVGGGAWRHHGRRRRRRKSEGERERKEQVFPRTTSSPATSSATCASDLRGEEGKKDKRGRGEGERRKRRREGKVG